MKKNYKKMYEELAEVVRGCSPNWTHEETLIEAAKGKDRSTDEELRWHASCERQGLTEYPV